MWKRWQLFMNLHAADGSDSDINRLEDGDRDEVQFQFQFRFQDVQQCVALLARTADSSKRATRKQNWSLQHNKIFYLMFSLFFLLLFCILYFAFSHQIYALQSCPQIVEFSEANALFGLGSLACLPSSSSPLLSSVHSEDLGNFVFALAKHCKNICGHICDSTISDQQSTIDVASFWSLKLQRAVYCCCCCCWGCWCCHIYCTGVGFVVRFY